MPPRGHAANRCEDRGSCRPRLQGLNTEHCENKPSPNSKNKTIPGVREGGRLKMLKGVTITYNTDRATRVSWELCTPLTLASDPLAILCHIPAHWAFPLFPSSALHPPSHSSAPDTLSELTGTAWHCLCLPEQRRQLSLELGEGQRCYKIGRSVQLTKPCIMPVWALGIDADGEHPGCVGRAWVGAQPSGSHTSVCIPIVCPSRVPRWREHTGELWSCNKLTSVAPSPLSCQRHHCSQCSDTKTPDTKGPLQDLVSLH